MSLPTPIPPGATILYDVFGNEYYTLPSGQVVFLKSGVPPTQIPITSIIGTTNRINVTTPSIGIYQIDISNNYINSSLSGLTPNYFPIASSSNTIANSLFFQTNDKIINSTSTNYINFNDGSLGGGITLFSNTNGVNVDNLFNSGTIHSTSGIYTGNGSNTGYLQLYYTGNGNITKISCGNNSQSQFYILPTALPTVTGQVLSSTTGGTMSWMPIIQTVKTTVTSVQILQLNTTPIQLIPAPGAGFAIDVISIVASIATYAGTPYATNTTLLYIIDTATVEFALESHILVSTVARINKSIFGNANAFGATSTQLLENKALMVKANTGNPTAGNSDINFYITYKIITL